MAVSSPFLSKYTALDRFAASQLEKVEKHAPTCTFHVLIPYWQIEDRYGVDLVSKSVGAVAYPIGYSLGLAGFARSKVVSTAQLNCII